MKTLEEFVIKEIQDLRTENIELKMQADYIIKENIKKENEAEKWKAKYEMLVELLKQDFKPEICTLSSGTTYFKFGNAFSENNTDDYYIEIFDLKEKKEKKYE